MEMDDSADSECELVIDETIITSSDQDEFDNNENITEKKKTMPSAHVSEKKLSIFHPTSISSSDMQDELFNDEPNTCSICNESFRYNIALICHLEMEHTELKVTNKRICKRRNTPIKKRAKKANCNAPAIENHTKEVCRKEMERCIWPLKGGDRKNERKSCDVCKKVFSNQIMLKRHTKNCVFKFQCKYCSSKFGWESKYKTHLFKKHNLNAAVICKVCSEVYPDMTSLAVHSRICCQNMDVAEISVVEMKQVP